MRITIRKITDEDSGLADKEITNIRVTGPILSSFPYSLDSYFFYQENYALPQIIDLIFYLVIRVKLAIN